MLRLPLHLWGKLMEYSLEKPKVSIIIPTYNSGETLTKCLESIHGQTYPFFEVIIIDNFSSDNTLRIANEFGAKIIRQRCNPAFARNIGIANSTGKYILFLDSDQVLSPQVVKECLEKCKNGKAGMVAIPEVFVGKGFWSSCSAVWKNCYQKIKLREDGKNVFQGEPRFFGRNQIIRAGMFNKNLLWGEDYEFYERIRRIDVKGILCKSRIYHFEPASLRRILFKIFRYGRSMPTYSQQTRQQTFLLIFRNSWLTFKAVFKEYKESFPLIIGCAILLFLKTCSIMLGVSMDRLTHNSKG